MSSYDHANDAFHSLSKVNWLHFLFFGLLRRSNDVDFDSNGKNVLEQETENRKHVISYGVQCLLTFWQCKDPTSISKQECENLRLPL